MTHTKSLAALVALVALQILAAIWLWWPRPHGPVTGQPWLVFSPQAVTRVTLTSGSKDPHQTLTLAKKDGKWQLPDAGHFPADAAKVKRLLQTVAGLKGTLPVAVTQNAAKRFRVARDKFSTQVTLGAGGKQLGRFYAGNAAGANRVYLRHAGSKVIEAQQLPSTLLSASASGWRDHGLLHLSGSDISKLVLPDVTLVKHKTGWQAEGSTVPLDKDKVTALVQQLTGLDFQKVVGKKAGYAMQAGFKVSVDNDGKTLTYEFAKVSPKQAKADKNDSKDAHDKKKAKITWQMTRSDLPYVFTVSAAVVKNLQAADTKALAKTPAGQKSKGKTTS